MKSQAAEKIRAGKIIGPIAKKMIHPRHLLRMVQLQKAKKSGNRVYDDPQLQLYSKILPGGFLHYGYFDDPDTLPQEISLNDVYRAQLKYAELILDKIQDAESPVLDVGCGMGGLIKMMLDKGISPTALSPEATQIHHIKQNYPGVPAIESKLEEIDSDEYENRFGTVVTAESLQYLNHVKAPPLVDKILKPGGRWIACDYFRIGDSKQRCEHWDDFEKRMTEFGWKFVHQQDITPNVLPTIRYVHMWGNDIGRPILNFLPSKIETKQPAFSYLLADTRETIDAKIDRHLAVVDPATFAATSKYMLIVMERAE